MEKGAWRLRIGVLGAVLLLILVGPARLPAADRVPLGYSAISGSNASFWVAKDAGIYARHGLDPTLAYIASSSTMAQAMLAGEIAFSTANGKVVVDAVLAGGDLVLIGVITPVPAFYIMARPEIREVADLRGKPVGVTRFGSSTDFTMRLLLRKSGLEPDRDVPMRQLGGMPELAVGLSQGAIVAAPFSSPTDLRARKAGAKVLVDMARAGIYFPHVGFTTSRSYVRQKRDVALRVLKAYGEAVHFMHAQKEATKQILARYARIREPEMLEATWQYTVDFNQKVPVIHPEGLRTVLEETARTTPAAQRARLEQFTDDSLLKELEATGFFRQLWGAAAGR
ncbi:MAG: ABC transporter substrate-binding protein [Deltaproteobacteria bacterium]|nr:ABC transporter substrate-binding protein [Deltaproteobacteria bacterium]